mgnify:CR=1 FL=1
MGEYSWILWMIIPFLFFSMAGRNGNWGCAPRSRRSSSRKSEEIARLKQELEASQTQTDALKSRLEAVETIVTD